MCILITFGWLPPEIVRYFHWSSFAIEMNYLFYRHLFSLFYNFTLLNIHINLLNTINILSFALRLLLFITNYYFRIWNVIFTQWNAQILAKWFDEFWQIPTTCIFWKLIYFYTLASSLIPLQSKSLCRGNPTYVRLLRISVLPVLKLLMNKITQ